MHGVAEANKYYTYDQLAALLNIKKGSLAAMVQRGLIVKGRDYIKVGSLVRFKKDFVEKVLTDGIENE